MLSATARRSASTSISATWQRANSGKSRMSPSRCLANTTLPAPITTILGLAAIPITSPPTKGVRSPGNALESRDTFRNVMEGLLDDQENCHLRSSEYARIVKRADLDDQHPGQTAGLRQDVRAALGAELTGHRIW